jgi:hypothetical protein
MSASAVVAPDCEYNAGMKALWLVPGVFSIAAGCGGDDGPVEMTAPAMITITGTSTARSGLSTSMGVGVMITAYRNGSDTPVAMTTTDSSGNYSLVIETGGKALDGYLKGTLATYMDSYLYPPAIVDADLDGASMNMITPATMDLLANTLCGADQTTATGAIAVIVLDATEMAVAGATVDSSPAATKVCYNANGVPSRNATTTATDGVAYMFNVTGQATVSATKTGSTFSSHAVNARAGTFTTTLIQP